MEYLDTYIVTSGDSYNLQIWNRNPSGNTVQIKYASGQKLYEKEIRYIFIRVDPDEQRIKSIVMMTPEFIEIKFGKFGKPTIKHQLIITGKARESILGNDPPVLFYPDSFKMNSWLTNKYLKPKSEPGDYPEVRKVMSLELIRDRIVNKIFRKRIPAASTKKRGQELEILILSLLGYKVADDKALAGDYPDIPNQFLEIKIQDSPTIDLGLHSPQFDEPLPSFPQISVGDIRYLIALTNAKRKTVEGLILCPGNKLGEHFSYVAEKSYKVQRTIPMEFFKKYDGKAVYNPS